MAFLGLHSLLLHVMKLIADLNMYHFLHIYIQGLQRPTMRRYHSRKRSRMIRGYITTASICYTCTKLSGKFYYKPHLCTLCTLGLVCWQILTHKGPVKLLGNIDRLGVSWLVFMRLKTFGLFWQGRSRCERILCVDFVGWLRMELRLHASVWHPLCGLQRWLEEIPQGICLLVPWVPPKNIEFVLGHTNPILHFLLSVSSLGVLEDHWCCNKVYVGFLHADRHHCMAFNKWFKHESHWNKTETFLERK